MEKRGVCLFVFMFEDLYIKSLMKWMYFGIEERLFDCFLIGFVFEIWGVEWFWFIEEGLIDFDLKWFYKMFWIFEVKYGYIYVKMVLEYFLEDKVY